MRPGRGGRSNALFWWCSLFGSLNHRFNYEYCHPTCRTLEQAASVPVVYATAYYSLVVRGRLRPGETVLIHSGSGGVGQAAIAIALSKKCKVFTTVGECWSCRITAFVRSK